MNKLNCFLKDEQGATLIEYALLATLVAVAGIIAMQNLGLSVSNEMTAVGGSITR